MNKRYFSYFMVAVLTMMFSSCSKTENGNVEYIPFQETADGQWGMISLDGKVLFKEEFKNKPTIVRDGRFFVRTKDGVWEMYDATEKPKKIGGTPEYLAPEIILNKGHGMPVDWWTMGILLYEMLVGIDPFSDDDPMMIYQKVIKGKIRFPKEMNKEAKSLIKHLLVADTTKRYGCLKNGVKDIVNHSFFDGFNWRDFIFLRMQPPYVPNVKSEGDTSCFSSYPDSDSEVREVPPEEDPFTNW